MANLLADGANWTDSHLNSPPSWWTGTKFEFTDPFSNGLGANTLMTCVAAQAGDTVAGTLAVITPQDPLANGYASSVALWINAAAVDTLSLDSVGSAAWSHTLAAGDIVSLQYAGPAVTVLYGGDFTLTPTPAPPPAPPAPEKLMIELRTSKDGAHNWGYWRQHDMGAQGNFRDRPIFRKLGFGRRIVMHIRASGDRGRDLVACSVDTEPF